MKFLISFIFSLLFFVNSYAQQVSDFTVTDTYGNTHKLYTYLESGKKVVLDFFFVGCSYCELYSPMIQQSYENFGCNNGDVIFLGIDFGDTDEEVQEFDSIYGLEYPSVSGLEGGGDSVVSQFNITAYTTLMVIDTNKQIIKVIDPPTTNNIDSFLVATGSNKMPCTTSIYKNTIENNFRISNPVNEQIIVFLKTKGDFLIEIYDINGRLIESNYEYLFSGANTLKINANLKKGVYIINFINNSYNKSFKLIKQ